MMTIIAFFQINNNYLFEGEKSLNDYSSLYHFCFPLFDWQIDRDFINNSTNAALSYEEASSKILYFFI